MMRRVVPIVLLHFLFAAACAAQSGWTPTVDTFGSTRAQYLPRDQAECRELARQTPAGPAARPCAAPSPVAQSAPRAARRWARSWATRAAARRSAPPWAASDVALSRPARRTRSSSRRSGTACAIAATTSSTEPDQAQSNIEESPMKIRSLALAAAVLGATVPALGRADDALAAALEKVAKDQIAAFNKEDVDRDAVVRVHEVARLRHGQGGAGHAVQRRQRQGRAGLLQVPSVTTTSSPWRASKVKVTGGDTPDFQNNVVDGAHDLPYRRAEPGRSGTRTCSAAELVK